MDFDKEKDFWVVAREVQRLEGLLEAGVLTPASQTEHLGTVEMGAVKHRGEYVVCSVNHAVIAMGYARMAQIATWEARHVAGLRLRDAIRDNWNHHGVDKDFMDDVAVSLVAERWGVSAHIVRDQAGTIAERKMPPDGRRALPDIIVQIADEVLAFEDHISLIPCWRNLR